MDLFERTTRPTIVFTDGAAKGNPGPGGWGAIVVTAAGRVRELGGGSRHTTNNRMELTAPIQALSHLETLPGQVAVYTDSTYVIRGIREWVPNWCFWFINWALERTGGACSMKLDWFAGKQLQAVAPGLAVSDLTAGGKAISDHDPIVVSIKPALL